MERTFLRTDIIVTLTKGGLVSAKRASSSPHYVPDLFEPGPLGTAVHRSGGIESRFDIAFVADLALREKQVQQNYRPVIAVHKWFARRPGTLFRALLLAEFGEGLLREDFYRAHALRGIRVADPFMGGGTPLIEANRLGCDVIGFDINPMAWWIVRQEIEAVDLTAYSEAAAKVAGAVEKEVGQLYRTRCEVCGRPDAHAKYFLWVKTRRCTRCHREFDLFPGYLVAENNRHPANVLLCPACGSLCEVASLSSPGACPQCGALLGVKGPAQRGHCPCPHCGTLNTFSDPDGGPPRHRMFAIEYHCDGCRPRHDGRFFKRPDDQDRARFAEAEQRAARATMAFVPDDTIPPGDETGRLLRWGYRRWSDLFNARQSLGLELLCREVAAIRDDRVRGALATNVSDLLRYQNMLCRYDTRSLKSLDIFSVHGFPVGLVQCESNLFGIRHVGTGLNVGSGGWSNVVEKFIRAKEYCERPFEVRYRGGQKTIVPVLGEWIGERTQSGSEARLVDLRCQSATDAVLSPDSLDAVFTDPPYLANVQYAELMDFCYVWLRRLLDGRVPEFRAVSTRNEHELTANATALRGVEQFTAGLSRVFVHMARALKPGAPLAFTYHHNDLEAYLPVAVALLDAGFACTASLPAPGEMGGSIHIHGTGSSIVDTVFVCRTRGRIPRVLLVHRPEEIAALVAADLRRLAEGGVRVTRGDARCIAYGHLIRLAIWRLRQDWNAGAAWGEKIAAVRAALNALSDWPAVEACIPSEFLRNREEVKGPREGLGQYQVQEATDVVEF